MSDKTRTRTGRQRRDRLPHNRQRDRVFQLVREHDGAVDAVELASQIGLHVTTVRFHLDALCDEGVIARTTLNLPGRGRPRTAYEVIEDRLDYRVLAEILAMELGQTVDVRGRRARLAGQKWAARITGHPDAGAVDTSGADRVDAVDRAVVDVTDVFTRMGFSPEPVPAAAHDRERVIRLHSCPVRDLARAHPEVGCGVHLGLLQGLTTDAQEGGRGTSRPELSAQLEPFVEPELCVARVVAG